MSCISGGGHSYNNQLIEYSNSRSVRIIKRPKRFLPEEDDSNEEVTQKKRLSCHNNKEYPIGTIIHKRFYLKDDNNDNDDDTDDGLISKSKNKNENVVEEERIFIGKIISYDKKYKWYTIRYVEDNDTEELDVETINKQINYSIITKVILPDNSNNNHYHLKNDSSNDKDETFFFLPPKNEKEYDIYFQSHLLNLKRDYCHNDNINFNNNNSNSNDNNNNIISINKEERIEWIQKILWSSICFRLINNIDFFDRINNIIDYDNRINDILRNNRRHRHHHSDDNSKDEKNTANNNKGRYYCQTTNNKIPTNYNEWKIFLKAFQRLYKISTLNVNINSNNSINCHEKQLKNYKSNSSSSSEFENSTLLLDENIIKCINRFNTFQHKLANDIYNNVILKVIGNDDDDGMIADQKNKNNEYENANDYLLRDKELQQYCYDLLHRTLLSLLSSSSFPEKLSSSSSSSSSSHRLQRQSKFINKAVLLKICHDILENTTPKY